MRNGQVIWLVAWVTLPLSVLACKYSVRDVGFVELTQQRYRLYVAAGIDETTLPTGANVVVEQVDATADPDHVAAKYFSAMGAQLVLRAPDGRVTAIGRDEDVASVVTSPLRERLLVTASKRYATVLLIPGTDAAAADAAETMLKTVAEEITNDLPNLPKPVAEGPLVVRVSPEHLARERILLWSLGVDLEKRNTETQVVLLMGRLRKFGDVMRVPGMKLEQLRTILGYVGQDCECALDRRWMEGIMVPHVWNVNRQISAMKALGFDPGNPMVQTEVSQILSKPRESAPAADGDGYGETVIHVESDDAIQQEATAPDPVVAEAGAALAPTGADAPEEGLGRSASWTALVAVLTALLTGGVVALRGSRGRS